MENIDWKILESACLIEDLKKLFGKIFGNNFLQEFENFTKKSTNLLENYDEANFFNPYVVRHQALNNKIELVELLQILLHISKYRGYKEFYLDSTLEEKDEETKKAYAAVGEVKKIFQENNYRSVAEMVIKNEKFRHSQHKNLLSAHNHNPNKDYENKEEVKKNHKHFIFPREKLEEEVRKILIEQSKHYPQLPKILEKSLEIGRIRETRTDIEEIIFRQRDFEDGPTKLEPKKEKELGGLEKVQVVHQQVFEWLISSSGYQPKILSREEKESGKKRETFRKQLEELLNKLVGKGNYSFPKGVEFKTGFLDYLKENSYQKTIFYQIGQIIFENVSPWRRKSKLDILAKKYGLEPFQVCLTKLEKYDKERPPASVSFLYMIEAIKAFLDGKKYVRNPVVFRSFNQTRKILKNLFLNYPQGFATINIETGRDLWNSEEERNKIERKNQDQAKEKKDIVEKLRGKKNIPINETNIKKYRLWEDQNEKL
ncbi:1070_t:CDS:2 [Ambispora leptoticha]|uniref:1070_t:CDS:1 n=1 Tax=Ambispora leptoticha TaxID=144679 RepID=A0A9N8VWR1_9GLOM|nr:1070_t:CDS:2 [Ambispora leptoticha]